MKTPNHNTVSLKVDDWVGTQEALFAKGYVWQSPAGMHTSVREDTKYTKSLVIYLDKGYIARSRATAFQSVNIIPEFTGDKWWNKQ